MKKRRGKGTPHPRKIKALRDLTNQQVDDEPEDVGERFQVEKESGSSSESPWVRLSSVHGRVAAVCAKIDRMMLAAHRLGLTNKISNFEVNNFAVSLTEVESILVKWEEFLSEAADRSTASPQKHQSPPQRADLKNLIPLEPDSASKRSKVLSYSPLVSSSHPARSPLFLTPLHSEPSSKLSSRAQARDSTNYSICLQKPGASLTAPCSATYPLMSVSIQNDGSFTSSLLLTPVSSAHPKSVRSSVPSTSGISHAPELDPLSRHSGGSSSSSQLPVTPGVPLSARASRLFRPSSGSESSSLPSPPSNSSFLYFPGDCNSPDLMTPRPPPELLRRYPFLGNPSQTPLQAPKPLSSIPGLLTAASASPILSTPAVSKRPLLTFHEVSTPENEREEEDAGEDGSGSPGIVDDFTASTVKRLGEKGLEEELWFRLQLGSAAARKFVRRRPVSTPSWKDCGKKNLEDYLAQSSQAGMVCTITNSDPPKPRAGDGVMSTVG